MFYPALVITALLSLTAPLGALPAPQPAGGEIGIGTGAGFSAASLAVRFPPVHRNDEQD